MPFFDAVLPSLEQGIAQPDSHSLPVSKPNTRETLYSLLRLYAIRAMEDFSSLLSFECTSFLSKDQYRRDLALIRRADGRQFLTFQTLSSTIPKISSHEQLLYLFLLAMDCGAFFAQRSSEGPIRHTLDFLLPEYQDLFYRLSNHIMSADETETANYIFGTAEIIPGRPMIACHRHPYDDIHESLKGHDFFSVPPLLVMSAIVQAISRHLMQCLYLSNDSNEQKLFQEMYSLIHQHISLLYSLLPVHSPLERMLLCQYTECYLYDSMRQDEQTSYLSNLFQEELTHEQAHLQKIAGMIRLETGASPSIPSFPAPLALHSQKGYIRETLLNVGVTLRRGTAVPVGSLKKGADFFRYQKKFCPDPDLIPSHRVISKIIAKNGMDYRYELAPHPIELMRIRDHDHFDIGR